jgi:hypothetical protein
MKSTIYPIKKALENSFCGHPVYPRNSPFPTFASSKILPVTIEEAQTGCHQ